MKQFLAVYKGNAESREASGWDSMDEAQRSQLEARGMQAWDDWMTTHESVIVVTGGPLGGTKRADGNGISDTVNDLAGFVVVQAESHADAARLFENHPHFSIFPGQCVEVMECLPIPGM